MDRRSEHKNYMLPGIYHITVKAAETLRSPFGVVVGNIDKPDGDPDAPRVALSPVGQMVEQELLHSIAAYYPMVEVQDYVVMPEHMHFIVVVTKLIANRQGRTAHLGQVIAGFKLGCNRRWWKMTGQQLMRPEEEAWQEEPAGTAEGGTAEGRHTEPAGTGAGRFRRQGPHHIATLPSLFMEGYCDVMPVDAAQLQQQRAYIKGNPRSRLMRTSNREWLQPKRGGVDTALTLPALRGYLLRECAPSQATAEAFALIEGRLLLKTKPGGTAGTTRSDEPGGTAGSTGSDEPGGTAGNTRSGEPGGGTAGNTGSDEPGGTAGNTRSDEPGGTAGSTGSDEPGGNAGSTGRIMIACDTYGDRKLLERKTLPVVCHRKDLKMLAKQQARCLEEAGRGAVLVSPRIAKGEQAIMDEAAQRGFPVVLVSDNGFPEVYHPSAERIDRCADGRLLIVTPWRYHYRRSEEGITVMECKTMNCLAQALCHRRDDWWKE